MDDQITIEERRKARELHLTAVAAERRARFSAWLEAVWKPVALLPCAARIQKSVAHAHQKRGVSQQRTHQPALARSIKRGKRVYPLWAYTTPRIVLPLRKPTAIGKAPPRGANWRQRQVGQSTIEFALILAVVAIVVLLVFAFGQQFAAAVMQMIQQLGGV